jgi:hypothetical protein
LLLTSLCPLLPVPKSSVLTRYAPLPLSMPNQWHTTEHHAQSPPQWRLSHRQSGTVVQPSQGARLQLAPDGSTSQHQPRTRPLFVARYASEQRRQTPIGSPDSFSHAVEQMPPRDKMHSSF